MSDTKNLDLLHAIDGVDALKRLKTSQLPELSQQMRDYLIETLAPIGGHLGAGLGVVELSVALHYVFDSPRDKIVWDVGHQAYPHKILTGRLQGMPTMRQYDGLNGFTKRKESEHDCFGAGHASTSISAAYGFAIGRDLQHQHNHAIAVIGDGSLGGGMAFEALNHAGGNENNLLVILNDNEMSIAPNVGAMSSYLARIITDKNYTHAKEAAKKILNKVPAVFDVAKRLEEHVKGMITPGTLFEELGFRYIGPIDGHDFDTLLPTLENCKDLKGPVLLHVLTKKGLGYEPAEEDPETWHGLGPYCLKSGTPVKNANAPKTYTQAFGDTLIHLAQEDASIVAITAAMPGGTGLSKFAKMFPERCIDVGIAEQHALTFAGGLACSGMKPVVAIYSTFLQRAYDQIIHDICIQNLHVVMCLDRAGIVGADGATHTGMFDIAYLRCLPNMTMMCPKDEIELTHMLKTALEDIDGPVAIRYPRGSGLGLESETPALIPVGKAEVIEQGKDGLIVSVGTRFSDAKAAVETLKEEDKKDFALLNLRFVKPLDVDAIIKHLPKHKPLVVVEEGVGEGGIGEKIAVEALKSGWSGAFVHIAMPDVFPEHGTQAEILRDLKLDKMGIVEQVRGVL
ncbi:1-deoxy-D-xylulose-5-phosphate synthase [Ghiorsea bivora]|uniref:1-deoxy-D-xylulose-5-phosphate synthase n=1 Tax=Ghiorsea bivora TaxID=1485545 RepID=UPI000570D647|nr:1-deoxy-D-xylulose-5-phosphate synthase [Ghiorsea bivora]